MGEFTPKRPFIETSFRYRPVIVELDSGPVRILRSRKESVTSSCFTGVQLISFSVSHDMSGRPLRYPVQGLLYEPTYERACFLQ